MMSATSNDFYQTGLGMMCPKCQSENVQMVFNTQIKAKRRGFFWWLFLGWWWLPIKWIFLFIPALIIKIFIPKRQKLTTKYTSKVVCQSCGYSWNVQEDVVKKPIYKKWWFWVIAVFLFFGFIAALTDNPTEELALLEPGSISESTPVEIEAEAVPTAAKPIAGTAESQEEPVEEQTEKPVIEQAKKAKEPAETEPIEAPVNDESEYIHSVTIEPIVIEPKDTPPAPIEPAQIEPEGSLPLAIKPEPEVKASSNTVWIPQSGKKYHSTPSCSGMKNPAETTEEIAKSRGYTRCSKCW
jgi:hypothetical protein